MCNKPTSLLTILVVGGAAPTHIADMIRREEEQRQRDSLKGEGGDKKGLSWSFLWRSLLAGGEYGSDYGLTMVEDNCCS